MPAEVRNPAGHWLRTGTALYPAILANVGIGTNVPRTKLHIVSGGISMPEILVENTRGDAKGGAITLYKNRSGGAVSDNDAIGSLIFRAINDAPEDIDFGIMKFTVLDASDGTEDTKFEIIMRHSGGDRLMVKIDAAEIVFNDGSRNLNFRVESNGSANALFVKGSTGNVGIGKNNPAAKLDVVGAITSATSTFSTAGPTDNIDVSGINTLFVDSTSNNVIIGGFAGGVDGQVLYVVRVSAANDVTIEHNEGGATQPILLHAGADETLDAHFGGWTFVCHAGTDWHDASHAKHV